MEHLERIRTVRGRLWFRRHLLGGEYGDPELRFAVSSGVAVRVVRGCYVDAKVWKAMRPEDRLLARTLAVAGLAGERQPVFSHLSAAVIWGLPVYFRHRGQADRVHLLMDRSAPGRSSATVLRHVGDLADEELCVVEGLRVTSLTRTVVDLSRSAPAETAIGCADAGLRVLFGSRRDGRLDDVEAWKEEQYRLLGDMRGMRGVAEARRMLRIADPRADSVAESVSRLQLVRLGIPHEIQAHVAGLDGENYWMDFDFIGQRTFGEMDGTVKYTDQKYMRGRTLEEVLLEEREREAQVKGITRKDFVRWGWSAIPTARRFGRVLRGFGLDVPGLG
ncbi:hypothetical protein [Leucobacter triazinivorans]|uniref:hypothetical protein n=1 Tax=Leucobacter triazinivorans TaxID=1784719 RepID=UPI0013EEC6F7|nr:hypothetical protein [Leucobacter triazinivorans]